MAELSLLELFAVLDGAPLPGRIELKPDPPIAAARRALAGQGDPNAALAGLAQQIAQVRPVLRASGLGVIERVVGAPDWSIEKTLGLASELHRLSALLSARSARLEDARGHLLRAIVCRPHDPNLAFHLVDVYAAEGRLADAFTLLERTYADFADHPQDVLLPLYRLSLDADASGAEEARSLYERILRRPDAGLFAGLAARQIANLDAGRRKAPSLEALNRRYLTAVDHLRAGRNAAARAAFLDVLAWEPQHQTSWFGVGCRVQGGQDLVSVTTDIDDERRAELQDAVQALRLAASLGPDPNAAREANRLLSIGYMELDQPKR